MFFLQMHIIWNQLKCVNICHSALLLDMHKSIEFNADSDLRKRIFVTLI